MRIQFIDKELAWQIRHEVMWPERELDYVKLEDDDKGIHYGLFEGEQPVSVISLFIEGDDAQFRKFATLPRMQGRGCGSALLNRVLEDAFRTEAKRIFCNARSNKTEFYRKFGLLPTDRTFTKGGKEYVIMERLAETADDGQSNGGEKRHELGSH
ncbi:MAG: family acetyltransferase [Paenibacillaceae bacterium]|nr:family acetyltransferase [Paenibacillaceae bacterium]